MEEILTCTTVQSAPGSNNKKEVFHTSQSSRTGGSIKCTLTSYSEHCFESRILYRFVMIAEFFKNCNFKS